MQPRRYWRRIFVKLWVWFFFLPFKFHPNLTFTTTPILHNKCEQQPQLSMHNKNDHYNYRFYWFFSKLPKMLQYFGQTKRTKIVTLQQKHHKDIRISVKHLMQPSFSCGVSPVNAQFQRSARRLEDNGKDATMCTHAYRGRAVTAIKAESASKVTYVIRQSTILQQQLRLAAPDPPVWTSFHQIR